MRLLFSILFLVLLFHTQGFTQATVNVQMSGTDGTDTIPLAVGLDQTATSGIDPQLGESDLPPFPPLGAFEIRYDLTPYAGEPLSSYKDYRYAASFPFTGQVEHLLWWQTSETNLPIDITYDLPDGSAMTLRDQLGGTILNLGPFTGSGTVTIPASYTNVFAKCLLIMDYTVVPVELTSFTATVIAAGVQLNWTTATELNNQRFEIERKSEANWVKIGFVPGNGTTTEPRDYSFIDNNVPNGIYTYRLKQLDFGGNFAYSNEVTVEVEHTPNGYSLSQNYPNPFNPTTKIKYSVPVDGSINISVYNVLGEKVAEVVSGFHNAGSYQVTFDAGRFLSGMYIYEMQSRDFVSVKKMMILK